MPIIRTEHLGRDFRIGEEVISIIKQVNLSIEKGKLTILRGRSGSGKTTLMNLLGTLDKPSRGKIFFDNEDMTAIPEKKLDNLRRLNMGFVFQSVALISLMSAYENVEFGLRIAGYEASQRKNRAEECLNIVGLGKRMHHMPAQLSGGEQQRVAIARAIAHKPKIIFADEPTAELDTNTGLQVVKLFKELVEHEGITILMTTHDPNIIEVADNVITIEDGEVVYE
ncbi:ABC transporter ATP-binding protein [Pseudobacteroides cellulosolvens]|uniref:Fe(3+)-transporting ATPase n=1 Tax=Pseudobacteroides cellulosolvens ATCC 35603 = DSM 2933 TaxID=398512 RepID=A0A0L6JIE7_9FIRM|nr:ABC transporter ATP-binding protein [Pseudobacteroides cellulosolvens]KNY25631.1 Fe(3+)-transporting ATPase [Pseudobacteroides cellulosolvens ATCC 35603 = DSM 2933]